MTTTPIDPDGGSGPHPHSSRRLARAHTLPGGAGTAGSAQPPEAGPATQTSPPAAHLPEGTQTPAGGVQRAVATSTPLAGQCNCPCRCPRLGERDDDGAPGMCDGCRMGIHANPQGRDAWKAAQAAHNAAKRRGRFTRAAKKTGPGMIRKPPPETPEGAA